MSGLAGGKVTAFVATTQPVRSRNFYEHTLGLRCVADDAFALAFDANGTQLRIQKVERIQPQPFTALGWGVSDIHGAMADLARRGVSFERYPFLEQDDQGIWDAPNGTKVAWFKDPDGNLLSLAESRE